MLPPDLDKGLKSGGLRPVYLLHGPEVMLKDRYVARLASAVQPGFEDFNLQHLSADETAVSEVLEHAMTMPFMGPPRVVIVRGVDRYPAEELQKLLPYLESPNDSTCLVLVADKPDWRLKLFKAARQQGCEVVFEAPRGRALAKWVREAMAERGMKMGEEAAQLLVDQVGEDLMELDQEIEKLSLYAGAGSTVSVETVRNVARAGHRASVFRLGDALGRQDAGTALTELRELLTSEHHLPVLAMMVRHFRLLLKAKLIEGSRLSQNEAASELGVPPFAARQYLDQARGLTLADIKKGLIRLQEANLTLISSPAPDRAVMEGLVLDLAGLKRSA